MADYNKSWDTKDPPKPKKPNRTPVKKEPPKPDPVYIATGSILYRFKCDGTTLRLMEGVSPQTTEARLKELKKYGHIKEVK
jgi:hypothetical protein